MKKVFLLVLISAFATSVFSQPTSQIRPIQWFSFEDALMYNSERAAFGLPTKKLFVDVYTDWCGWCKRMDATTFSHPVIAELLNSDWIPVKLNAERTDTVIINEQTFVNENPGGRGGSHQLAQVLLQGQMGYPSVVLIDETGRPIQVLPGYKTAPQLEMMLRYFYTNEYRTTDWEEYQKTFQGIIRE
ncbi:MAG: DUF255 domain-containing protein [Bacteroidales bacterium]|nr:DUF255 domain-containing protein [Bacteroidales bacterium]